MAYPAPFLVLRFRIERDGHLIASGTKEFFRGVDSMADVQAWKDGVQKLYPEYTVIFEDQRTEEKHD